MQPFGRYRLLKMCMTSFDLLGSLQVNGNVLKLKIIYNFLSIINGNHGVIMHPLVDADL